MKATANISNTGVRAGARKVTFRSRHAGMVLWRKQTREIRNVHGELQHRDEGVFYTFRDGVLDVYEGQDVMADGWDADAEAVVEQDAVSWLRNHSDLNSGAPGGFFEEGREPDRLLPTDDEVLAEITAASVRLDAEALVAILEREESTHKRPLLLRAALGALEAIQAIPEALHPAPAGDGPEDPEGTPENAEEPVQEPVSKPAAKRAARKG